MISVEARGRLGNQMFQFAFGLAASRRLGTTLVMEDDLLRRYFLLDGRGRLSRRAWRSVRYRAANAAGAMQFVWVGNDDYADPETVLDAVVDGASYGGYFQSERFFGGAADAVRRVFAVRGAIRDGFDEQFGALVERSYVCCHLRRTDYRDFRGGVLLPRSYYEAALGVLDPAPDVPIVFVGDELDEAHDWFGSTPNARFERNSEITDLLLLTHASAVVASNSSFAWWGAWLNERAVDRVVCPRHWLGFKEGKEWPVGVVPSRWTQVPAAADDADRAYTGPTHAG